jgi:hypothetical protein
MSINYKNSKVYKIWSPNGNKIYIGSTTKELLCQRMTAHRKDYKRWKQDKCSFVSSFLIFEEYGLENCFIELLETRECQSKDELRQLEGKYIRELLCVNKNIAGRTLIEWKEEHPDYQQTYRQINKDRLLDNKKDYYLDNKEAILSQRKQYYEDNKAKVLERHLQKFTCECGSVLRVSDKSRHFQSQKHCKFIESKITIPEDDVK